MIPTVLAVGLLAGALLAAPPLAPLAVAGTVASLAWGVLVGVGDASIATFAAGAVLAAANFAVGAAVGAATAAAAAALRRSR